MMGLTALSHEDLLEALQVLRDIQGLLGPQELHLAAISMRVSQISHFSATYSGIVCCPSGPHLDSLPGPLDKAYSHSPPSPPHPLAGQSI